MKPFFRLSLSATGSAPAKKEGIHTCLDTNGFVRRYDPVIDELLEVTDLVMLDLKQMNDEIHQNLVGVSNPSYAGIRPVYCRQRHQNLDPLRCCSRLVR